MGLNSIHFLGPFKRLILAGWHWDARQKFIRIKPALGTQDRVLDIGSGYGTVTQEMRGQGFQTTPVDVRDQAIHPELQPVLADGAQLPFANQEFDTALLLTVLHHTPQPEQVLAEAARVSTQVLVIEDVYRNKLQQYLTYFADSLFNFEFRGHPHTNKTRAGWMAACERLGLSLELLRSDRFLLFFRQETYRVAGSRGKPSDRSTGQTDEPL